MIRCIIILSITGRIERICVKPAWGGEDQEDGLDSGQKDGVRGPAEDLPAVKMFLVRQRGRGSQING